MAGQRRRGQNPDLDGTCEAGDVGGDLVLDLDVLALRRLHAVNSVIRAAM